MTRTQLILLEDIQSKVQATLEAVIGFRAEILTEIQTLRLEVSRRTEVFQLQADVRRNTEEIRSMREVLERKADPEALLRLEARVEVMEKRLGIQ